MTMHTAKTQISLGSRPVWSESSLSVWRKLWSLATHWAHSEDSDQTGRRPRLIWVFSGRTCHLVGFVMSWFICEKDTYRIGKQRRLRQACAPKPLLFANMRHGLRGSFEQTLVLLKGCACIFKESHTTPPWGSFSRETAHLMWKW